MVFALRPLYFFLFWREALGRDLKQSSAGETAISGDEELARGEGEAGEHPGARAHLLVAAACPEVARGGVVTRAAAPMATTKTDRRDGNGARGHLRPSGLPRRHQGGAQGLGGADCEVERVEVEQTRRISPVNACSTAAMRERKRRNGGRRRRLIGKGDTTTSPVPSRAHHAPAYMPTREKRREGAAKSHTAVTRRANRGAARWQHCSSLNLHLLLHFSLNSVQQLDQPQEQKLFIYTWSSTFLTGSSSRSHSFHRF
jgi:hypothetical protein